MGAIRFLLTIDKRHIVNHCNSVTASLSTAARSLKGKGKASRIQEIVEDTKEFMRISKQRGGLIPLSTVATILGVSRQRVYQLVSEGVFGHWTFHGMKWVSQAEVVEFAKLDRRGGENQHGPSVKELWKASRASGKEFTKARGSGDSKKR